MSFPAIFRGNVVPLLQCSSCSHLRFQPLLSCTGIARQKQIDFPTKHLLRFAFNMKRDVICSFSASETEPDRNEENERKLHEEENSSGSADSASADTSEPNSLADQDNGQNFGMLESKDLVNGNSVNVNAQTGNEDADDIQIASGSPLPGLKPQQLDEAIRIPKETIDILKDQVFGFDTFFVTSQEPYEGGVLFKGNLRGQAARSYEKISKRMQDRFGDLYKLFLLINPEDDKPVAVVVPRITLQPDTTAVPEWFAAGAFGLVTIFTLLLRNVPALQANLLSVFDNFDLLENGLPGALVTALILGVHEISHTLVAQKAGIKLGVPYFVPSWQIGSFGAITRILNIVPKREDLLKFAAAGPLAGFSLGFILLLLGFFLPPADGLGVVVDPSVFHESLLAGGIAKLLLGDALKEGTPISVNPLVLWSLAGLLINAINSIPAGELDGGRISFSIWGRKTSARLSSASIGLLGISALFSDVAFYWVVLIFVLQRGPIAPLSEEITDPDNKYIALGIAVLLLGLLVCLPYPFPFNNEAVMVSSDIIM
ncbi:PREDICTED: probable zinc metalloprotease EGY2, chloroplastic [Ipomoea nil]|uniref:probable zinc metalloprotease EGY2, chloroplastic n=1 Tax=Ipomoea nil TaxID=35883 RepID=UPI000900DA7F|nr:PREDICTED: probable zinc metalloprotease EGY2, chloroplastic [Ipomoea nil]